MNVTSLVKHKSGQQMLAAERLEFVGSLVEIMLQGLYSDNQLSKMLKADRRTVNKYKPAALKLISAAKLDQGNIRALQVQRAYNRIERLTLELDNKNITLKDRMAVHNQITKLEQHLALITGLNVETKINIDHKKLVITRAHPDAIKKALNPHQVIDLTPEEE